MEHSRADVERPYIKRKIVKELLELTYKKNYSN